MMALGDQPAGSAGLALRLAPAPDGLTADAQFGGNQAGTTEPFDDGLCGFAGHVADIVTKKATSQAPSVANLWTDSAAVLSSLRASGYKQGRSTVLRKWLSDALTESGVTQSELARRLGYERQTINKVMKGKRDLSADELVRITHVLGVEAPTHVLGANRPLTTVPHAPSIRYVAVVGDVAAGVWKEVQFSDFPSYEIPIVLDPRWPVKAVRALVVRGESINRQARDGDYVITLALDAAPRGFQTGDWVVAERTRGDTMETTVKRVVYSSENGWELWPDSTDPRHQEPLRISDDEPELVRVAAFVLQFVRTGTDF